MDIKGQIRNKYYTPTEPINTVYDIFKDFFNEVRVDLQVNKGFKADLEYLLKTLNEDTLNVLLNYNLNNALDITNIRIYTERPPFYIFVHFPDVTITNEHNDSINIKDLYARIPIYWNGTLKLRFKMIVTTYTRTLFNAGYCHSHLHTLYDNKPYFDIPCLGTGPLVETCNVLTSNFTEDNWRLFCVELSRYVTVESLLGTPYYRMTNITNNNNNNKPIKIYNSSNYIWNYKELLIETVHNLISKKLLNFKYVNGEYNFANSEAELIRIISNEFIAIYNDKFNKKEVTETLQQLANKCFIKKVKYFNDNYYFIGTVRDKIPSNDVLFTFKGKDIKTVITEDITNVRQIYILNPDKVSYIATKLLEFINMNYGKEQIN